MNEKQLFEALKKEVDQAVLDAQVTHTKDMVREAFKAASKLDEPGATVDQVSRALGLSIRTVRGYTTQLFREGALTQGDDLDMPKLGGGKVSVPRYFIQPVEDEA